MTDYIEEPFIVLTPRQHKLSCIFHRKTSPYIDDQNRQHVIILCHGYMAQKNSIFLPQLSRDISKYHSVRFDFHGCAESTGREDWDYGGYEDEARIDLRSIVEYLRNQTENYFVRAIIGHSRSGTTVLLYALFYDDVPYIVNIAGRYRLERGITERFSKKQLDELNQNGSFIVRHSSQGDFRVTKEAVERRKNLNLDRIDQIRNAKVLNIWGDKDTVIPGDDIDLYNDQLKNTLKTDMVIVSDADHCFTGKEDDLIKLIQSWIE